MQQMRRRVKWQINVYQVNDHPLKRVA
jgi:hypothetical protein